MSDDLKSCPFCGSDDLGSGGDDKVVGYWCNSCQAAGPNHYGRYEWNSRADRIEQLVATNEELEALIKDLFILLDKTEETDEGRVFRPNHISSCRAEDGQKLENLLRLLKAAVEGRW